MLSAFKPLRHWITLLRGEEIEIHSNLHSIAQFWGTHSPGGPLCCIVERVLELDGSVHVIDQVLFVDALRLCNTNDLNFILLATHLGLVNEVHIHTFHVDHYFTAPGVYYRLRATSWELVRLILSHIS